MESIIQYDKVCFVSGERKNLEKHHVFGGNPNRKISEREELAVKALRLWAVGRDNPSVSLFG